MNRKILSIVALLFFALLPGCNKQIEEQHDEQPGYSSFREIPGVTDDEIKSIEALKGQFPFFAFGSSPSTEAFYEDDGEITGFVALLCNWLTELFDIPFVPSLYEWGDLISGLDTGKINFTSDLTATDERRKVYFMTDTVAERSVKLMRISGSAPLPEIAAWRPLHYIFLEDTTTFLEVSAIENFTFEYTFVNDYDSAYNLLKSGKADGFFEEGTAEAAFDVYGDVISEDFFPMIYSPVSLTTKNPALAPIISVVQKALLNGGIRFLTELYNQGNLGYIKHKLFTQLSEEEKEYIRLNPVVSFVAEYDNYPVSFYNTHEGQWQGITFDVLRNIEELTGLEFKIINGLDTEWPQLIRMLEYGEASMISELIRSDDREGRFLWPKAAIMSDFYTLISKSDHRNINVNEILYTKIGLARDTAHAAMFKRWFPNHMNTVEYETIDQTFNALEFGEIEMVMSSQNQLLILTNYHELAGYKANFVFDRSFDSTFGFNINEAVLCSIIDRTLALIDLRGITGQWVRRTYDYREKLVSSRLPWLLGASALLLCVLILLLIMFQRNRHEGRRLESLVQKRTAEVAKQNTLMHIVNEAATLLLGSDSEDHSSVMIRGMEMLGRNVDVDRVSVWQNHRLSDGKLYYKVVCQWASGGLPPLDTASYFSYEDFVPSWEDLFSRGISVNAVVDSLDEPERSVLNAFTMKSILAVPIFLKGDLWGYVSFDDYRHRRVFPEVEEHIIRSWGLLIVGAIQRQEIALNMQKTLRKLEAVTNNYKGIIWSVDRNGVLTNFNGQYLKKIGVESSSLEGKQLEFAEPINKYLDIVKRVEKSIAEGPQDWIGDINDSIFHSYTTPIYDNEGNVTGVVGSTDDVTELTRLQRDLENALKDAKAASRAKSDFLANMSHEIRTPMNAIIGMTSIGMSAADNKKKDYCFTKIDDASKHLLGVINDILDMSKIEANKFDLSPVEFSFEKMLQSVVNVINFRVDEKKQKLAVHIGETIPQFLIADDQRLMQVVTNLISNAVKFTNEGGVISLDSQLEEEKDGICTIQISVSDNGIGISPEQQERLFQSFQQAETSTSRKFGGTGLGLSISKNIVEMMGGKIWVSSELGKGSVFAFTIQAARGKDKKQVPGEIIDAKETVKPGLEGRFAGRRILLAEDVEINREIVIELLAPTCLVIDCAENGEAVVRLFREAPDDYDMIFMDVQMPKMDGYEATGIIRSLDVPKAKTIPIIAMTANVFREDIEKCLEAGMNGHLGKPLNLDEVMDKLYEFLPGT